MTYHPQNGRGYGHVTVLKFCCLLLCSATLSYLLKSTYMINYNFKKEILTQIILFQLSNLPNFSLFI